MRWESGGGAGNTTEKDTTKTIFWDPGRYSARESSWEIRWMSNLARVCKVSVVYAWAEGSRQSGRLQKEGVEL